MRTPWMSIPRRANNGAPSTKKGQRGTVFSKISLGESPEETKPDFELLTGLTYASLRIHLSQVS